MDTVNTAVQLRTDWGLFLIRIRCQSHRGQQAHQQTQA